MAAHACPKYFFYNGSAMIQIEEFTKATIGDFWTAHWEYLNRDIFPFATLGGPMDEEDRQYFKSADYRGTLERYMDRSPDTVHMLRFLRDGVCIGYAQYITYKSEDNKCFILDYWLLPAHRGQGIGRACFEALCARAEADGAEYYAINVSNDRNRHFWQGLGFVDDGRDEWDMPLMQKRG